MINRSDKYFSIILAKTKEKPLWLKYLGLTFVITFVITMFFVTLKLLGILPSPSWNDDTSINTKIYRIFFIVFGINLFTPLFVFMFYNLFFISYKIEGDIKFFEFFIEIIKENIRLRINFDDLKSIVIDYYEYERLNWAGRGTRKAGADNKITITYGKSIVFEANFLCKKQSDIMKIENFLLYLNKKKGVKIIEYYRGKAVASY